MKKLHLYLCGVDWELNRHVVCPKPKTILVLRTENLFRNKIDKHEEKINIVQLIRSNMKIFNNVEQVILTNWKTMKYTYSGIQNEKKSQELVQRL